jgi:hypothetical protein
MLEVPTTESGGHNSSYGTSSPWTPRLLEDSEGLGLYVGEERHARVKGESHQRLMEFGGESYKVWYLQDFCWARIPALRLLQGATIQGSIGPRYIVVDARIRPVYCPSPGMDVLYLAEPLFSFPVERVGEITVRLYTELRPLLASM